MRCFLKRISNGLNYKRATSGPSHPTVEFTKHKCAHRQQHLTATLQPEYQQLRAHERPYYFSRLQLLEFRTDLQIVISTNSVFEFHVQLIALTSFVGSEFYICMMVQDSSPCSPVDVAFEELFEVIPELKMFAPAQVVPGADHSEQDKLMAASMSLEEARMYKSDPDLRIKGESFLLPHNNSFSEVSNWLQCSMQLGDSRVHAHARDPFLCSRDPYAFPEQVDSSEWRPPVLDAMALIKQDFPAEVDELLINQARNVCQLSSRREATESQCKVFMPSIWDAQLVDGCQPGYDLDFAPFPYEKTAFSNGLKNGLFKSDSAEGFLKEADFKKEDNDMALERDSDSPASFSSVDSPPDLAWSPRSVLSSRGVEPSAFREPDTKKFALHRHKTAFKKSGRPRLCQYLLELLEQPDKYSHMIDWIDKEKGVFKFINSSEVARMWGRRRNKPSMKYENFARSLRTYIAKGILIKPRSKLVYQFAKLKS